MSTPSLVRTSHRIFRVEHCLHCNSNQTLSLSLPFPFVCLARSSSFDFSRHEDNSDVAPSTVHHSTNTTHTSKVEQIINFDHFDTQGVGNGKSNGKPARADRTDLLLNLSIDSKTEDDDGQVGGGGGGGSNSHSDLPEDLFGAAPGGRASKNVNLLVDDDDYDGDNFKASTITADDLFSINDTATTAPTTTTTVPLIRPTLTGDILKPAKTPTATTMPTVTNNLQRNTSTPNLAAKLDPFGDLNSFMNMPTLDATKVAGNSIPRVSSYSNSFTNDTKPTTATAASSSSSTRPSPTTAAPSKPDYSRSHFSDLSSAGTGVRAPKMAGNEFEDLLGGFKKAPTDTGTKSISQLRREELVSVCLHVCMFTFF